MHVAVRVAYDLGIDQAVGVRHASEAEADWVSTLAAKSATLAMPRSRNIMTNLNVSSSA